MTSPEAHRVSVFLTALEHEDLAACRAYLEDACAGDPVTRQWVEEHLRQQTGRALTSAHVSALGTVASSGSGTTADVEALLAALRPEEQGDQIGPYRLLELLGEGGFGAVWKARQETPVRREVALKILKVGMDSRQIVLRFEQERQALALLDHPGIAKVYDAGATLSGRPYFAMELVAGEAVTDFCNHRRLPVRECLELFMRVCFAVQHAHQKALIHRDLKPANILVAVLNDGSPAPKVIDFGLAKVEQELQDGRTLVVTHEHAMVGTPLYMSPEQAEGSGDLDTRTDIYALGVILYELLTGRTPHDPTELSRQSADELRRAIREQEPRRPSSALRAMGEGPCSVIAQHRATDAGRLRRTVRGELDDICMVALEKDRRRRYATAAALAADLQHYLLNEPIAARRPSGAYRLRKFARRHWEAVAVAAALFVTILVGALVSVREAVRAKAAERQARAERAEAAEQREQAETERTEAQEQRARARLNEYVADIGLAQQSLRTGNLGRARTLLERHRPAPGGYDLRDWSWRYLWALAQGDPHTDLPAHPEPAGPLALSPEGRWLAVGGPTQISVLELPSHTRLATLPAGADWLGFTAGGRLLATLRGGTLHLWRTADWQEYAAWPEGPGPLALSADGTRAALAVAGGVRLRRTETWAEERFLPEARGPLAFSPDGGTLVTDSPDGLWLWDLATGASRLLPSSAGLFAQASGSFFQPSRTLAFAEGGQRLVAVQNGRTARGLYLLRLWDTASLAEVAVLPPDARYPEHTGAITSLTVSPDGHTAATASLDHSVRLWHLPTHTLSGVLEGHASEVGGALFTPAGDSLLTCDRLGEVKLWPLHAQKPEEYLPAETEPLGFTPEGQLIAYARVKNALVFSEATTVQPGRELPLEPSGDDNHPRLALSADGHTLAQALAEGGVRLYELPSGKSRVVPLLGPPVEILALSADGGVLITGRPGEALQTRDLRTGTESLLPMPASRVLVSLRKDILAIFIPPLDPSRTLRTPFQKLDPSAPTKAADGEFPPDSVILWNLASGTIQARLESEAGLPLDAAFSPDGTVFATAGADNVIRLWGTGTGVLLGVCIGHKQMVHGVAFADDGRTLASVSDDNTLRLWNVLARQELLSLLDLGSGMTKPLFSPDSQTLAIAVRMEDGRPGVRLYRAR